jgi:diguanylate cyclase (GGDEF)-like protein
MQQLTWPASKPFQLPALAVREARLWGDRAVAGGHGLIILALGLAYLATPVPSDRLLEYVDVVWATLSVFTVLWLFRAVMAAKRPLSPLVAASLTIIEFAVLFAMIGAFQIRYGHEYELLLKSPSLQYVYIFLVLQIFRFDKAQILVAGASAAGGYLLFAFGVAAIAGPEAFTRDYVNYLEGPYILKGAVFEQALILALVTFGLYIGVHRGTMLIERQVHARLIADEALEHSEKANTALDQLAHFDTLTGLPNRKRIEQLAVEAATSNSHTFAVLLFDIDRFRSFNDGFGRDAGNALILAIAERLRAVVPSEALFGRIGADEFAILLPCVDCGSAAAALAQSCQAALTMPVDADGIFYTASLCVGVAISQSGDKGEDVTAFADIALNAAKSQGTGSLVIHKPSQRDEILARLSLETDLREATKNGALELYYQPIFALGHDGSLVGWEALARWKRGEQGYVSPGVFIPLAEETGLISAIGSWALVQAARDAARFIAAGAPASAFMSVNVSPRQLQSPEILKKAVETALALHGHLKLELTESAVVEDPERGLAQLKEFVVLGAQLSLDDFGTGTSSLATLGQYPFSTLKIDRSFVIATGANAVPMLRAIVSMARALGLDTVAEGVETPEEIALLTGVGATYGQGFGLARPQPAGSILQGLAALSDPDVNVPAIRRAS